MVWAGKLCWFAQSVCLDDDTRNDDIFPATWTHCPPSVMDPIDGFFASWMPQRCRTLRLGCEKLDHLVIHNGYSNVVDSRIGCWESAHDVQQSSMVPCYCLTVTLFKPTGISGFWVMRAYRFLHQELRIMYRREIWTTRIRSLELRPSRFGYRHS